MDLTTTGDGIITALQVLSAMRHQQMSLAEIRKGFTMYPQVLLNVKVSSHAKRSLDLPNIQQAVKDIESQLGGKGRVLLRASGTEPVNRIMVEGEDENDIKRLADELAAVVRAELEPSAT